MKIVVRNDDKISDIISYESNLEKDSLDEINNLDKIEDNLFSTKKEINNFIRDEEISPCDDCYFGIEENFIRKDDELKEKMKEPPYEFENDDKVEYYDDKKSSIEGN